MTPTGEATAYGVDYTARELMPWELSEYTRTGGYDLRFLFRPIGYPTDPGCVSHQPGALARHRAAGRLVLLYHRSGDADGRGGRDAGYGHALAAVTDAATEGYPDHLPLVFVLAAVPGVPWSLAAEYLEGAAAVAGFERTWCAGPPDLVHALQARSAAAGYVLHGPAGAMREGIAFRRWTDRRVYPGRIDAGLVTAHVDLAGFESYRVSTNGVSA
ncbi:hypothetical protein AB0A74_31710 [Saccharothrix sp. NPDC042600]|uniref:hypothetical protein n=1 Tax=Saccharothrix TaxID=2071 RepID=UPI0033DC34E1|nr:hypothetical protein GCM10017745_19490 [Saccharothrix mutabilis subsp. capreolus]